MNHIISHKRLSIDTVKNIISSGAKLELGQEAEAAIVKCRKFLDTKMEDIGRPVYGVTTGFGSLCNITIPAEDLSQLQHNLVMSHACGTGEKVRLEIVKLMLLLKVQSLSSLDILIKKPVVLRREFYSLKELLLDDQRKDN